MSLASPDGILGSEQSPGLLQLGALQKTLRMCWGRVCVELK